MIPTVNSNSKHIKNYPLIFQGINRNVLSNDSDWFDVQNVDTYDIPTLSPRKSMKKIRGFEDDLLGFSSYENAEFYITRKGSTTTLSMYMLNDDGSDKSTIQKTLYHSPATNEYQIIVYNRHLLIFPTCEAFKISYQDEKIHKIVADLSEYERFSKAGGNKNGLDNLTKVVEYNNRLFAIDEEDNIRSTVLGNYKIWDKYAGVLSDSWATDVASAGKFVGINKYRDHVIIMKNALSYELYGSTPAQFTLKELFALGTINHNSIAEVNGRLFFVDTSGVYVYAGGNPRRMSYKLMEKYIDASAYSDGRRYYLSLFNGTDKRTYVYDSELDTWTGYSDKYFKWYGTVEYGNTRKIRAVDIYNVVYEFETGNEVVEWQAISKIYDERTFQKKTLRKLKFKCIMDIGSSLEFYISVDQKPFKLYRTLNRSSDIYNNIREIITYIPLIRVKNIQIMIKGYGNAKVYGEREMIFRSDK